MSSPVPPPALDSLRGLVLGDAFGDQWLGLSPDEAQVRHVNRELRPAPWEWTDDSAMALVVVRHLTEHEEIHQDVLARDFAAAYTADPARKYGPSMHQVLRAIGDGADWRAVTAAMFGGQGSHGNGAAMRVAPLGAWFATDLDRVAEQARLSAVTTHFHPEAAAGAVAVALAAALAARSRGEAAPGRADLLRRIADLLPDSDVRSGLRIAARLPVGTSVRHAAAVLGSGHRLSAPDTVPFALWAAAGQLDDLPEAIWSTLGGWGDTDTTCAIAAGVVAARTGLDGVPQRWLTACEAVPGISPEQWGE
ncbi:ADP-ribosylglycohydrolase family protein [Kitasatospora sp. RB6PN24]|uniref:ADP-ribosylglycohydrolase family protein n=1 Tax=Kitasatospora humi TaxID=2893891 RepID=UPI001E429609|nr:ADP-ribosylglycohydrolase family protein [Kitasatospora humi]MCC9310187.1 ADP-ribosylglycohydrolase family protein [Kitasatospora humi]